MVHELNVGMVRVGSRGAGHVGLRHERFDASQALGRTVTKMFRPSRLIRSSAGLSRVAANRRPQVLDGLDRLPIHLLDDVARLNTRVGRAAVRVHFLHHDSPWCSSAA